MPRHSKNKPRGRPVAFSGKQRKAQLRATRQRRREKKEKWKACQEDLIEEDGKSQSQVAKLTNESNVFDVSQLRSALGTSKVDGSNTAGLNTQFLRESNDLVQGRKQFGLERLEMHHGPALRMTMPDIRWLKHPERDQRLVATAKMLSAKGEQAGQWFKREERQAFMDFLKCTHSAGDCGPFEHNLEVWRQLWRVMERSDVLCVVADVRAAGLHIPPSLYTALVNWGEAAHVSEVETNELDNEQECQTTSRESSDNISFHEHCRKDNTSFSIGKSVSENKIQIPTLGSSSSKIDKVTSQSNVLTNSMLPVSTSGSQRDVASHLAINTGRIAINGGKPMLILLTKTDLVPDEVIRAWTQWLSTEFPAASVLECPVPGHAPLKGIEQISQRRRLLKRQIARDKIMEAAFSRKIVNHCDKVLAKSGRSRINPDLLNIGLIGQPSVGKTTVLNLLKGNKVARVSVTPGATKHLQTILIPADHTDDARSKPSPAACLLDSPGLLFPSVGVPHFVYELLGVVPQSQIRETFSAVRFLASKFDLQHVYKLPSLSDWAITSQEEPFWTPFAVCTMLAEKRRWFLNRSSRPDAHRAGLQIISDVVNGVIPFWFWPPTVNGSSKKQMLKDGKPQETNIETHIPYGIEIKSPQFHLNVYESIQQYDLDRSLKKFSSFETAQKSIASEEEDLVTGTPIPDVIDGEKYQGDQLYRAKHQISINLLNTDNTLPGENKISWKPIISFSDLIGSHILGIDEYERDDTELKLMLVQACLRTLSGAKVVNPTTDTGLRHGRSLMYDKDANKKYPLLGGDIVVTACTGSGKTMAFLFPVLAALYSRKCASQANCQTMTFDVCHPRALIIAPTRELCLQVYNVAETLSRSMGTIDVHLQIQNAVGGFNFHLQKQALLANLSLDLLVATPGRLLSLCGRVSSSTRARSHDKTQGKNSQGASFSTKQKSAIQSVSTNVQEKEKEASAAVVSLNLVEICIIDEADRMLSTGFHEDLVAILSEMNVAHRSSQSIAKEMESSYFSQQPTIWMFSATWPRSFADLALSLLKQDAMRIRIGNTTKSNLTLSASVKLSFEYMKNKGAPRVKFLARLLQRLLSREGTCADSQKESAYKNAESPDGQFPVFVDNESVIHKPKMPSLHNEFDKPYKVLIFALYKREAAQLCTTLNKRYQISATCLHGDLSQSQRQKALGSFRTGEVPILVATDVAARGLDVQGVGTVINYSLGTSVDNFVHRVGRCGRASMTGHAITFVLESDEVLVKPLVSLLHDSKREVPKWLLKMAGRRHQQQHHARKDTHYKKSLTDEEREEHEDENRKQQLSLRQRQLARERIQQKGAKRKRAVMRRKKKK